MPYCSLFDRIAEGSGFGNGKIAFNEHLKYHGYEGSLGDVLDQLEADTSVVLTDSRDLVRVALHAPRVIRATVDNKISHPSIDSEALVRESLDLGLRVYRGVIDAPQRVRAFRQSVQNQRPSLLTATLKQPADGVTWEATRPERSSRTVQHLALMNNAEDLLMIALGRGGVAAGMDVFLRYCDLVERDGSGLYVARFSTQKLGDRVPRLTQREIAYLQGQKNGRHVVLFDEDSASGRTLSEAKRFFAGQVFQGIPIETAANFAMLNELKALELDVKIPYGLPKGDEHKYIKELTEEYIIKNKDNYNLNSIILHPDPKKSKRNKLEREDVDPYRGILKGLDIYSSSIFSPNKEHDLFGFNDGRNQP